MALNKFGEEDVRATAFHIVMFACTASNISCRHPLEPLAQAEKLEPSNKQIQDAIKMALSPSQKGDKHMTWAACKAQMKARNSAYAQSQWNKPHWLLFGMDSKGAVGARFKEATSPCTGGSGFISILIKQN